MPEPVPPLRAQSSIPTDDDRAWLEHYRQEQRNTPARLEETAKYLAGIISISLTIFIDKRPANLESWTQGTLTGAAVLWMLSALLSFAVLFPWRYRYREDSPADVRHAHRRVVRVKWTLLLCSVVLFLAALGIGVFAFAKGFVPAPSGAAG